MLCPRRTYFWRPRLLNLGYSYLSSADIRSLIEPSLDELANRTGEAATLAVLDDTEALIVARACKRTDDLAIGSGSRLPLNKTALGHVLLAALPTPQLDALFKRTPKLGGSATIARLCANGSSWWRVKDMRACKGFSLHNSSVSPCRFATATAAR